MNYKDYYLEGKKQYDKRDYFEAIEFYRKAIKQNEQYEPCYFELGRCYEKLHYEIKAIEYYQTGLQMCSNPEYISDYHINIGNCYILLSNPDKSIFHFNEGEKCSSNYIICQYNKAVAYTCIKDYEKALTLYKFVWNSGMMKNELKHHMNYCIKKLSDKTIC